MTRYDDPKRYPEANQGTALAREASARIAGDSSLAATDVGLDARIAAIEAQEPFSRSWHDYVHDGSLFTSKRIANCDTNVNLGLITPQGDRTYYVPEVVPAKSTGLLTLLEVDVSTTGASFGILYVYSDTGIVYPDAMQWQSAKLFPTGLGYLGGAPALQCTPGELVWFAYNYRTSTDHVLRALTSNSQTHILGKNASGTASQGCIYVDEVGASDPVTQPPTGLIVGSIPAIHATWA